MNGVTLTTREEAAASGFKPWTLSVAFGARQDGTQLLLDFMKRAEAAGGRYVSDVHIVLASDQDGEPVECRTEIVPESSVEIGRTLQSTPGRTEMRHHMVPVTKTVFESQFQCQSVTEPRTVSETYYESQYDPSSKTTRSVPRTRMVTRFEHRQKCGHVPMMRTVTRFEYQFRSEYIPPRLELVSRQYTRWSLKETLPTCAPPSPRTGDSPSMPHRVEGEVYGCSLEQAPDEPQQKGGESESRSLKLRRQYRQSAMAKGLVPASCQDLALQVPPDIEAP
ncbi:MULTISPECIES: hypothetical protein [Corallococcus]|uniref:hypothetical protein n=2 Tax=Myxococcaceae TaxID=31 RepID=UPI000F866B5B|nr:MULTISPECIES: hypothetical protein [Corallococcus]NRD58757.1 hypothetical protein [Corallococcus exiguus]